MTYENGKGNGAFLLGFLVGGLGGAIAGLLLAPQPGEKTRDEIRQKAADARANAESALEEALERAEAVATAVGLRAERFQTQAKVMLEEGQRQLTKAVQETKAAVDAAGTPRVPAPATETDIASGL
jgi:gas vesicle protein